MRLDPQEHASRQWRVGQIAPDFQLIDVWALPAHGTREEFVDLVEMWRGMDPAQDAGWPTRALFAIRSALGRIFSWDETTVALPIPDDTRRSLRERLPAGAAPTGEPGASPVFAPVFEDPTEWAAEVSNATVHAVLQLGWVPTDDGQYRGIQCHRARGFAAWLGSD